MSGPVVVIGFIMLVPSILGMLFGLLMLIGTGAAGTQVSASTENETRAGLVAQGVPETIVNEIISGKTVSNAELAKLPQRQQSAVQTAQISHTAGQVGTGAATAILGGFSIFVLIMSFVGGLLGWLLVMRKTVPKCSRCGAVVPASGHG